MDCEKIADIYNRSCLKPVYSLKEVQAQLDKNCLTAMQMMKRSCYQFTKKEDVEDFINNKANSS